MSVLSDPTRAEGLRRLADFLPQSGKPYREHRSQDFGPQRRDNVSLLSAYLRYRLVSESEVAQAVLAEHTAADAQGFLNELLWRPYWKGWLEGRPGVYMAYRRSLADDLRRFTGTETYRSALEGRTGISAFDDWNRELLETGYLHHHARMSYASIWIFSLRLPWTLGAAHFHQHLLDGDPASNTLGWRWVGGLHTPGKHFVAHAEEIAKFTDGRYALKGRLNESPLPLTGPAVPPVRLLDLPLAPSSALGDSYALWVTPDDLSVEQTPVGTGLKPRLVVLSGFESLDRGYEFSPLVKAFVEGAMADAKARLEAAYGCQVVGLPSGDNPGAQLGQMLGEQDIPHLIYYQPAVGPWQELATALTSRDVGLRYFPLRRSWDAQLFPHSSRGYFQFQKAALPILIRAKGKL